MEKEIQFSETELRNLVNSVTEFLSHNEPSDFDDWFEKKLNTLKENKTKDFVVPDLINSLNWLTKDCIIEVKRLWDTPNNEDHYNPRVKALKLIIDLGTKNGFLIRLTKAVEIKDKILAMNL